MKRLIQIVSILLAFAMHGWLLSDIPVEAQSQKPRVVFKPPRPPRGVGSPGQRSHAGSRSSCRQGNQRLTALVPMSQDATVWGTTVTEQPTFWFYVPYSAPEATGEFVLEDARKQQTIYKVALSAKPGVVRVPLVDRTSLQVGQNYRWYFNIYCGERQDEIDGYVEGSVTRQPLTSALQHQIEQAPLQQRIHLLATNGIWYDALTIAAAMRCTQASDPTWTGLLQDVGLDQLTQAAIITCPFAM
jgi:hypothetical protein